MLGSREEIPILQSDFYRFKYYKVLRWTIISLAIMFILLGIVIYSVFFQPTPKFYANTLTGRILPMPPART